MRQGLSRPVTAASQLIAEDHAYLLRRSGHRGEHIERIEAGAFRAKEVTQAHTCTGGSQ
jgi:hypothetical protein